MKLPFVLLFAGLLSSGLFAQDTAASANSSFSKIKLSGYGYYMFGQLISGIKGDDWESSTTTINHLWTNTCLQHLSLKSDITEWFTAILDFELSVGFNINSPSGALNKAAFIRNYKANITSVEGIMHWDFQNPIINFLIIETGLIPYTTNPQVKTLGNYLFRSSTHPPSIQNKIDYPWADLLGGVADARFFENKITFEVMIASEFIYVPWFDVTPAFGINYKPNEIIDVGGTIAFSHAIPIRSESLPDSISHNKWQGTKLDFRVIFDTKPLFGGMPYLKKDQFKVYAELAFLGLEDKLEADTGNLHVLKYYEPDTVELKNLVFPANSILQRMPFMIGLNLPTGKILDLLSIELEWFYSPYANDWFGNFGTGRSDARQPVSLKQWDNYINKDNFSWSLYMIKSAGKFEVRGIIGRDHTIYTASSLQVGNFEQTMKRPKDWHWNIQLRYNL